MRPITLIKTASAALATAVAGGLASRPAESSASTLDTLRAEDRDDQARAFSTALAANLVMNAGWSWIFFSQKRLGTAAVVAAALTASSADLTRRAVAARGPRGAVLAPYPLWCAFATALSTRIWMLNRA
jgi:benzodiazapine receptor